jgi:hypothetical protein
MALRFVFGNQMTYKLDSISDEEAKRQKPLVTFKNYCNCGGYAWQMNGRSQARPHMDWCPQREEYNAWYDTQGQGQ